MGVNHMNRFHAFLIMATAAWLMVAGCGKKVIDAEPYGRPSESAAAGEAAAAGSDAAGSSPASAVQEESLADTGARSPDATAAIAAERAAFENQDVLFEFDSAVLTAIGQAILRDKARWMQENREVAVIIEGHCDDRGTNEYNLALGEKRARSARDFLIELGVESSRISMVSYGEERPLIAGVSEEARAQNRRAHFVIEM